EGRNTRKWRDLGVGPEPEIAVGNPALGRHGGRFHHDRAEPAECKSFQVDQFLVARDPVDRAVPADPREDQPGLERQAAELEGREELHKRDQTPTGWWQATSRPGSISASFGRSARQRSVA